MLLLEDDIRPGAVILHVPTQGRYLVRAVGRMRTPPVGEWVPAARYTSLDEPESLPEFYRPLTDFGTFELVQRAPGVAGREEALRVAGTAGPLGDPDVLASPGVLGAQAQSLTDDQCEALIGASDGAWHEDVFHIGGPELMALLRSTHAVGFAAGCVDEAQRTAGVGGKTNG